MLITGIETEFQNLDLDQFTREMNKIFWTMNEFYWSIRGNLKWTKERKPYEEIPLIQNLKINPDKFKALSLLNDKIKTIEDKKQVISSIESLGSFNESKDMQEIIANLERWL